MDYKTIKALFRIVAPFIVSICAAAGIAMDADSAYIILMIAAGGVYSIRCGWLNNSVTAAAKAADEFMYHIKATEDEDGEQ